MKILNEAIRHHIALNRGMAYIKSGNSYPLIMFALDGKPIPESSDLVLVKTASRKLNDLHDSLHYSTITLNSSKPNIFAAWSREKKTDIYNRFFRLARFPSYIKSMDDVRDFLVAIEEYKDSIDSVVDVLRYSSPLQLAKFLITKQKNIDPYTIKMITGVKLEDEVDQNVTQIGNTQIIFPDNLRGKKQQEIINLVTATNKVFALHGMSYLTNIKMFVKPIPEKWAGFYYFDSKIIAINPSAKASKTALHTMVHEIGHKYYYEFMPLAKKHEFITKYKSLISGYKKPEPKKADNTAIYKSIWDKFSVGDELTFIGRGSTGNFNPYEVTEKTDDKINFESNEKSPRGKPWVTGHFEPDNMIWVARNYLLNGKQIEHEAPKKEAERPTTEDGFGLKYINHGWFPTQYSSTSAEEWFAECWAFYLLGQLEFEPLKEFIENIIKK